MAVVVWSVLKMRLSGRNPRGGRACGNVTFVLDFLEPSRTAPAVVGSPTKAPSNLECGLSKGLSFQGSVPFTYIPACNHLMR